MNKIDLLKKTARWTASRMITIVVMILALWGAYTLGRSAGPAHPADPAAVAPDEKMEEVWTCTMHPQIRMPEPGDCPICGMELVREESAEPELPPAHDPKDAEEPVGYACAMFCVPPLPNPGKCPVCGMDMVLVHDEPATEGDVEPRMTMSEAARALANIQTAPVIRRHVTREVFLVGMIETDETRLARVTAWVGGRLDRLHVRHTGAHVARGAPLAGLYSPELLTARAELLQAKQSAARLADSSLAGVRESADSAVRAARERLRLWGLSEAQVRALESGDAQDTIITIPAPMSGTVIERHVQQGDYVDTGSLIFTVADLSVVWVQLKAYESDLAGIELDQPVHFTVDAWPGEHFHGKVAFISPVLDSASRTVDVRVEADNADGRLKPGMFAKAAIETLATPHDEAPLLIPATAPLITGKRAVAYVEAPGQDRPTFEGREILLGHRAGDYYVVKEGLHEDERVVVKGAFRIDSALQIRARPSMMSPVEDHEHLDPCDGHEHADAGHEHARPPAPLSPAVTAALQDVFDAYALTQQALADDDNDAALAGYARLADAAAAILDDGAKDAPTMVTETLQTIRNAERRAADAGNIETARFAFLPLSNALIALLEHYPDASETPLVHIFCPMAVDDAGAGWLQRDEAVRNPYFGEAMLTCGGVRKYYGTAETQDQAHEPSH